MLTISIAAEKRDRTGKGAARSTRRDGKIPGTLYGQGKSITLRVDRAEFAKKLQEAHGENVIWDVHVDGGDALKSLAREIQHDPISRSMIHVDFQHIDMTQVINVMVAVHLVGEPVGVRTFGGILEHMTREIEVECLPTAIPASIDVNVEDLEVGDSIHQSDLPTDGFEFVGDGTRVIAQVAAPTVEAVAETEEGEEGEEGTTAEASEEGEEAKGDGGKES
ncbi:MAG: 50S ribosomal protein L25 [Gemmatimonadota bacterium]|nr:MAG: 50S ribosomal protein L25 [Gemmatimonadota bacterium]